MLIEPIGAIAMKNSVPGAASLLFVLAAGLAATTVGAAEIRIRSDEWLPYNGPSTLKPPGYMIELAQLIAKANGHTIQYSHLPWDDAIAAVRAGTYDCVVGAMVSDAEGFSFPATAWGRSDNQFFVLEGNTWRYTGIDSLAAVRLAVIEGYSYGDEIDAYIEQHKDDPARIQVVSSQGRAVINAISRIVTRKVDALIEDGNVANSAIGRLQLTGRIVPVGSTGDINDIYIACTPADPRGKVYADMFSAGIDQLRASGELATILGKYSLGDWKAPGGPE
jgi:polar amino acid transport system substrate-binding protein